MPHMLELVRYHVIILSSCILSLYGPVVIAQTTNLAVISTLSSEKQVINQLNKLVKAKKYEQAYALANLNLMDLGGEPNFDYLMGLAALNTKSYQVAMFSFERAVMAKPKWQEARFQLAKTYFYVDNLAAARLELEKVQKEAETPALIALIAKFISQIDDAARNNKRQIINVIAFSSGFDNNINSGTQADSIFLEQLGTEIPLSDESREINDTPFNFSYQGQYRQPINQNSLIIAQLGLYRTEFANTSKFERTLADVSVKYQDVLGEVTYQLGIFYRPMILDGEHLRDQFGIQSNWNLPIDAHWSIGWQLGLGNTKSKIDQASDLEDAYISFTGQYRDGPWRHSIALNVTDIEARTKHRNHSYYKLDLASDYSLSSTQQLKVGLQWQQFNYNAVDPTFLIIRDDTFWRASVGWRYLQNDSMIWNLQYRRSEKMSNGDIYAYSRDEIVIGLIKQF
ncbi:MAG: tetratricopeptide (TPR) repeat protein [Paraglaciecola sp.]|jgi:tetratricopeptide (TPR) repeat protein